MIHISNPNVKQYLLEQLPLVNGKRRTRLLTPKDVETFLSLVEQNRDKSVQVRSDAVANSYKYPAPCTYLRYNYATGNIQIGVNTFKVAGGDNGDISIKKYNYGF